MSSANPGNALYCDESVKMLNRVDEEVTQVLSQPWIDLKKQNDTFVARHTLLVLAMVVQDPLYQEISAEEQNIIKWACLLHDIAKLGVPTIEGRDHVHPIKSGIILLEIFE